MNTGCNKVEHLAITYPTLGSYGENILAIPDSTILNNINGYSLCADLGKNAELKIMITQLSGAGVWFYADNNGWTINDHSGGSQQFQSNDQGKIDLDIVFENGPGSSRIDYYENGSTITHSKTLFW